ncbi:hypothetical protein [Halomontanus rarus]|uniref:hypothetical protein n=1 Tax=Halomontanus rarus TaxID=3034020 RepID=UPI001A99D2A4
MTPSFTDDDLEKRVENANGAVVGTVTAVEGDTARVEPSAGVMDSIRAALGWERAHEDTVLIYADAIGERSDDVIRLEADGPTRAGPTAAVEESDSESDGESAPNTGRDRRPDDLETETGLEADTTTEPEPTGGDGPDPLEESDSESDGESPPEPDGEPVDETRVVEGMDGTGDLEPDSHSESDRESESSAAEADSAEVTDLGDETAETDERDKRGERDRRGEKNEDEPLTATGETPFTEETNEAESLDIEAAMDDAELTDDSAVSGPDDATAGNTADETHTDAAAELDPGVDADSLEQASRTETEGTADEGGERDEAVPNSADERDSTDEVSQGIDTDSLEEVGETGPRDETAPSDTGPDPATEATDPGVDVDSLEETREESDRSSAKTIDPETLDEGRTDAELGLETAARRIGPEIDPGTETVRLASENATDRRASVGDEIEAESEGRTQDGGRERIPGHAASPVAATFATQRTAIEQGQQVIERGMDANRRIARTTLEGQAKIQRQSLEVFRAATTGYVEAIATTMSAAGNRGSAGDRPDDEQSTRRLRDHLERLQELQDRLDEQVDIDHRHERTADLLEEQLEQVDRIQRELSADADRLELEFVGGLDSMYRARLEAAAIASLEELARADAETVAEAADVTEKRAEGWIEQAEVRV